jgi:hypothetical protein|nr:MAG TPA: hypothetical protein [Caudoviricetes sp.]
MSSRIILKLLFTALQGSLPYEYDEKYVNDMGRGDTIIISKTGSDRSMHITANKPYGSSVLDLALYDDTCDDDPLEISQWDADDPSFVFLDLITYIEKSF